MKTEYIRFRVYAAKHPMSLEFSPYNGNHKRAKKCGWYWIKCGGVLAILVRGLRLARLTASQLNLSMDIE
jgi:hypothetical protein